MDIIGIIALVLLILITINSALLVEQLKMRDKLKEEFIKMQKKTKTSDVRPRIGFR